MRSKPVADVTLFVPTDLKTGFKKIPLDFLLNRLNLITDDEYLHFHVRQYRHFHVRTSELELWSVRVGDLVE